MKRIFTVLLLTITLSLSLSAADNNHKLKPMGRGDGIEVLHAPIKAVSALNFVGRIHANLVEAKVFGIHTYHPVLASSISIFIGFAPFMFTFSAFSLFRKRKVQ